MDGVDSLEAVADRLTFVSLGITSCTTFQPTKPDSCLLNLERLLGVNKRQVEPCMDPQDIKAANHLAAKLVQQLKKYREKVVAVRIVGCAG